MCLLLYEEAKIRDSLVVEAKQGNYLMFRIDTFAAMDALQDYQGVVASLYGHLDGLSDADFGQRLSSLMDEQPHLTGFLFNLDEEFSENTHQELLKASLVIRDVFVSAGMPLHMLVGSEIDAVVEEEVKAYEDLAEEGEVDQDGMKSLSSSPELFTSILKHMSVEEEEKANVGLMISVLIRLMEEAAGAQEEQSNGKG